MGAVRRRILITGAAGMLGRTLCRRFGAHAVVAADRARLDIGSLANVVAAVAEARPEVVIHAAAMTAVDRCESERDAAFAANAIGAANVAIACQRHGARLIAISTDYVFAGTGDRPHHEWDPTAPRTVYGQSKLAGEEAIRAHCPDHVIARVAWLYGPGGPSFVHTMLKWGTQSGPALKVVDDQIGNPTSTTAVADALAVLLDTSIAGTIHLTCEGEATWYAFTRAIFAARGLARAVEPCLTAEYPRPAPRPANSRLEKRVLRLHGLPAMPTWQESLRQFVTEFPNG